MKYEITRDYIDYGSSRSGQQIVDVEFIVSHSTGNPGATAYANRNYFDRQQPSASAHTFIDDNYILEIIPLDEKAWHVRYNVQTDDELYGADANDAAIGVELAYGGKIDFKEAYERYVWYHAYLCDKFDLDPKTDIVSHSRLDPARRTDPQNVLQEHGISWEEFINDVIEVFNELFMENNTTTNNNTSEKSVIKGVSTRLPLKVGDEGPLVREVQQELIKAGFPLPRYGADGKFGRETENAVMRFQKRYGLIVDGLVGTNTLNKLLEVNKQNLNTGNEFPLPNGIWKKGDEGEEVRMIQRAITHLNFDPKGIDGIYGDLTEDAVRRFQSMFAVLKNDGIYGPNTKRYMEMELRDH